MTSVAFRLTAAVLGTVSGLYGSARLGVALREVVGYDLLGRYPGALLVLGAATGGLVGFFLVPALVRQAIQFTGWLQHRLFRIPAQEIVAGALGLIVGLLIAYLLRPALAPLPLVGYYLPTLASLLLGYLGWVVAVHKRDDLLGLLHMLPRVAGKEKGEAVEGGYKILDTSAIIDGRIADICQAGFIDGTLVIPSFVLDELRHIADSADVLKRNRGRRGLDILNRIQKELQVPVKILDRDSAGPGEVDVKLVNLARRLNAKIITNDFNLNKVAALHGVPVLNVNELANALKPLVLPGEEMTVQVIRDGKEAGQGVAYLDDGTMIVVDGGKRYIGDRIGVEVTSVLQTAAGRMIFAKPKANAASEARTPATSS